MPEAILIGLFDPAKLDEVWQLRLRALHDHPQAFGQPWESAVAMSPAEVTSLAEGFWTGGDNRLFIASDRQGEPVGMLGIARDLHPRQAHRMDIWGVYVTPSVRNQVIASRLARAAITYARTLEGVPQVHLTVWSENHAAVNSYARLGFHQWGTLPRALMVNGQPIDHDFMVLMLDQPVSVTPEGNP